MKASKQRPSDSDVMIDVLEEATRRSHADEPFELRQYGPNELPIVLDLIEAEYVRGETGQGDNGLLVSLEGITLAGRQFRDELASKRASKKFGARFKRAALLIAGWVGGLLTAFAKDLIAHFLR